MDNYKIDLTGDDILSKNSGIIIVYNNKLIYAFKFSSNLQKSIRDSFNNGYYSFNNKKILKPRIYCSIIILILKTIKYENNINLINFHIDICNDFDGHSQDIINILKQNLLNQNLFNLFTNDNITFVRHPKKSLIQESAQNVYKSEWKGIIKCNFKDINIHNLISKPKRKR